MEHIDHFAVASACLIELRRGSARAKALVDKMRSHALEGGLCLCVLGTSTEEICALVEEGAKIRALKFLREVREEGWDKADFVPMIRECVKEAGCSFADIGTSEEELASFSLKEESVNLFD